MAPPSAPGYFKTPLNQALVDDPEFSAWLKKRTPAGRWGNVDELIGARCFSPAMHHRSSTDTRSTSTAVSEIAEELVQAALADHPRSVS